MTTIEISDKTGQFLSFDLAQLLAVIEPFAEALEWHSFDFEPVELVGVDGSENPPVWVLDLFQEVRKSASGVKIDWKTLRKFARYVKQTIDATLIGVLPGGKHPSAPIRPDDPEYQLVIQAIDSSLWAVTSQNQDLIQHIRNSFQETRLKD